VLAMYSAAAAAQDVQDAPSVRTEVGTISNDYIAILPGYAIPDKRRGLQRNGFTTSFIFGNQFGDHWSVEGQGQGSIFEAKQNQGPDFYQWGGSVDLVYSLFDRRKAVLTPFLLVGGGALYDDVLPQADRGTGALAEAGLGVVTESLYDGLRLRLEGRYNHDFIHDGFNDYRATLGIEIPLGRVIERVVEVPAPAPAPVVETVIKEVPVPRPWIDSDGDGVDDEHDLCPNTPKGLKVDAHGCVIPGQQIELNGVTFEFNKARLSANAQTILDTIAPAFPGQPTLKVEIAGHTDSIGSAAANLTLSV